MSSCSILTKLCQVTRAGSYFTNHVFASVPKIGYSAASAAPFHKSAANLEARVPNPQKRLKRPHLVNPKELDRFGNPIFRSRTDTAENRADPELLKPLPKWDLRNRVVYPPIEETKKYYEDREEECPRIQPPFVVHSRQQIKRDHRKLRYAGYMITGMNVDDALDQLDLHPYEEAKELKETILEAIDLAINQHGFEFRSNMYVAVSHVEKGKQFIGVRKKARGSFVKLTYRYSNYIVCLVEGEAPKDFFPYDHTDGNWKMENRLKELRARTIPWDFAMDRPSYGMKRS